MKIERRIHQVWKEWNEMPQHVKDKTPILSKLFEKYQYICSSEKGEISLINMSVPGLCLSKRVWEIHCFKGNLFPENQQFRTKKEAMAIIRGYLE